MSLPDSLRRFRNEFKLTQKAVANSIGMRETSYSRYERGEREPAYKQLIKLADTYRISLDYLVGRSDKPSLQ